MHWFERIALRRIDDIGLSMLEQPLPVHAAASLRGLVDSLRVDVCADESVRTVADAARVVAERSATLVNLGHSKLGGPTAALEAARGRLAPDFSLDLALGQMAKLRSPESPRSSSWQIRP